MTRTSWRAMTGWGRRLEPQKIMIGGWGRSGIFTKLRPAKDTYKTGSSGFGNPIIDTVRGAPRNRLGIQQLGPGHAIDGAKSPAQPDSEPHRLVVWIELHVCQHQVEMISEAAGVVVGQQGDLAVPGKL
jgi:hypothetical protein